jgi:hypothetical protein
VRSSPNQAVVAIFLAGYRKTCRPGAANQGKAFEVRAVDPAGTYPIAAASRGE